MIRRYQGPTIWLVSAWKNATTSTAGVLRPEQFAKHVTLERTPCSALLSPWVEHYWSLRWELPEGASYNSAVLPHPACNLSVERGVDREGMDPGVTVLVTGVVSRRFDVLVQGSGKVHAAKFRPGGFASLTGVPARALRDVTRPAAELLPEQTVRALQALPGDAGPVSGAAYFDDALSRLAKHSTDPDDDYRLVLDVIATMLSDRSIVRVAQVEDRCDISARSLQRLFERYVGVSPKWVLARYRMHDAVSELDAGYDGTLADLAARYGWFDQAHFTREFRDLVGVPPSTYRLAPLAPPPDPAVPRRPGWAGRAQG